MVKRFTAAALATVLLISLCVGFYLGWDLTKERSLRTVFAGGDEEAALPAPSAGEDGRAEGAPSPAAETVPEPPVRPDSDPVPPEDNRSEGEKTVYLTFDDGPSVNTPKVLDILQRYGVKATFFVNGRDDEFGKQMYRRIIDEGHALGNHTYSHDYSLIYSSVEAYIADTEKLADLLDAAVGVRPSVIRFPGGSANHSSWRYSGKDFMGKLTQRMVEEGYEYFDWNVSAGDAAAGVTPAPDIVASVREGAAGRRNATVLFHDGGKQTTTVEALPEIIESLRKQGYLFAVLTPDSFGHRFI